MANPKVLERYRKSRTEWTKKEFADKLGMSVSTYNRMLDNESAFTIDVIQKAARLFKVDQEELLQGSLNVEEPEMIFHKQREKVSIIIQLDGTKKSLQNGFDLLTKMNAALT